MGLHLKSNIQEAVSYAFQKHKVNNPELENAITDAFIGVLTNRTILRELTEPTTEIQKFEENRRRQFRGR